MLKYTKGALMKKYFKTLEEQIEILISRNLIIEDQERAKDKLLNYNFYKVINGTRDYFVENPSSYNYRKGVTFREIEKLHEFDKTIKKHFLNSILDIERHLRSIISYVFMQYHPEAEAYLDPKNFKNLPSLVSANSHTLIKTIENYKEEMNYKKSMDYYAKKYDHVPFWFLINFISFGKLVNFYQTMKEGEAYEVANVFTKFLVANIEGAKGYYITTDQFDSFITAIKDLRNVVAHDNLILGYKSSQAIAAIDPVFDPWDKENRLDRQSVFSVYLIMQLFLSKSQFRELTFNLQNLIDKLEKEIDKKAFDKVMKDLGFPSDF